MTKPVKIGTFIILVNFLIYIGLGFQMPLWVVLGRLSVKHTT